MTSPAEDGNIVFFGSELPPRAEPPQDTDASDYNEAPVPGLSTTDKVYEAEVIAEASAVGNPTEAANDNKASRKLTSELPVPETFVRRLRTRLGGHLIAAGSVSGFGTQFSPAPIEQLAIESATPRVSATEIAVPDLFDLAAMLSLTAELTERKLKAALPPIATDTPAMAEFLYAARQRAEEHTMAFAESVHTSHSNAFERLWEDPSSLKIQRGRQERIDRLIQQAAKLGLSSVLDSSVSRQQATYESFGLLNVPVSKFIFEEDESMIVDGMKIAEAVTTASKIRGGAIVARYDLGYTVDRPSESGPSYEVALLLQKVVRAKRGPDEVNHYFATFSPSFIQAPGKAARAISQVDAVALQPGIVPFVGTSLHNPNIHKADTPLGSGEGAHMAVSGRVRLDLIQLTKWLIDPLHIGVRGPLPLEMD